MRISSNFHFYHFSADIPAVGECYPGQECSLETLDCFGGQIRSSQDDLARLDLQRTNPATGPIFVRGAKKGQLLKVDILDISLFSQGIVSTHPGIGILLSQIGKYFFQIVTLKDNHIYFEGIPLPIHPMMGVIGVAPEKEALSTKIPGRHGGNLDTKEISPGNTIYLPVFHEGALFALGDVHALMGDGEICGAGVEVPSSVLVRLTPLTNPLKITSPIVETSDSFLFLHSAQTLVKAFEECAWECLHVLQQVTGWNIEKLYLLMSVTCDFQVSQLVDPLLTVKIRIPKEVFLSLRLF
ncbi:MAG: acetamidase/formamidase family protein [Candidatus Caldatribacteriaceae bacterium]